MTAPAPGTGPDADSDTPAPLRVRIEARNVDDREVAAVTVAVAALLGPGAAPAPPAQEPAWRRAGLREASTARRVRSPGELERAERW